MPCCRNVLTSESETKKTHENDPPAVFLEGTVLTLGRKAATIEEKRTRRQYYAPFSSWGSVVRPGDRVAFTVHEDLFSGVHVVDGVQHRRRHVKFLARLEGEISTSE